MDSWPSHKKTNHEHEATMTHAQRYSVIIRSFLSGIGSDVLRAILEEAAENTDCTLGQYLLHCQTSIIYSLQPKLRHQIVLVYPPDESEPDLLKWNCRLLCVVLIATGCLDTHGKDDVSFIERTYQKHVQDETLQTKHSSLRQKQQPKPKREWIRTCVTVQRLVENLRDTRLLASVRNFICKIEMGAKTIDARIETHISLTKMIAELAVSHTDRINEENSALRKQLGKLAKMKQQYDAVSKPSFTAARSRKNLSRSMIIDGKETRPLSAKDTDIKDKPTRPKSALSGISQSTTTSRLSGLKPFKRGYSFDSVKTNGTSRMPFSNTSRDRQPLRSVNLVTPKLSQTRKIQSKENNVSCENSVTKADKLNSETGLTPRNDRNDANVLDNNMIISEDAHSDADLHDKNTDLTKSTRHERVDGSTNGITSLSKASHQMNGRSISRPHSLDVRRPHSMESRRSHSFDVFQRNTPLSKCTTDRNNTRSSSNMSYDDRPKSTLRGRNGDIVSIYTQSLKLKPQHKDDQNHTDKAQPSPRNKRPMLQQSVFDKQNDAMEIVSKPAYSSLLAYTRKYRPQIKKKEPIAEISTIQETIEAEKEEEVIDNSETAKEEKIIDNSEPESDNTSLEDETPATPIPIQTTKSTFGRFKDMLKRKLASKKSDDNKENDEKEKPFDSPPIKVNSKENVLNETKAEKTFVKSDKTTDNSDETRMEKRRRDNYDGTSRNDAIGQLQGMLMDMLSLNVHQRAELEAMDKTPEVKVQSETNLDDVVSQTNSDLLTNHTETSTEETEEPCDIKKSNRVRFLNGQDKVTNMPNVKHKFSEDRKRRQSLPTEVIRSQDTTFSSNPTRETGKLDKKSQALIESPTNDRATAMKQRRFSVAPTHDTSRSLHTKESNTNSNKLINKNNTTAPNERDIPINEDTTVTHDEEKDVTTSNAVNTKQATISSTENTAISDDDKAIQTIKADPQTTHKTVHSFSQATEKNTKEKNASILQRRMTIGLGSLKKLNPDKAKQSWYKRSHSESEFNPEALKKAIKLTEKQTHQSNDLETVKKASAQSSLLNTAVIFEEEDSDAKTSPIQKEDTSDQSNEIEKLVLTTPSERRKSIDISNLNLNRDKPKTLKLEKAMSGEELNVGTDAGLENIKTTVHNVNTNEKQGKIETKLIATKSESEYKTSQSKKLSLKPNTLLHQEAEITDITHNEQNGGQKTNKSQEIVTNSTSENRQPDLEQNQHTVDISSKDASKTLAKRDTVILQNTDLTKTQTPKSNKKKTVKQPKDRRKTASKKKHLELDRSKSETEFNTDALFEGNTQKSSKGKADKTKNDADIMVGKSSHTENVTIFEEDEASCEEDEASFEETKTLHNDNKNETDTTASVQNESNATTESKQAKTVDYNGGKIPETEDDPEAAMKRLANDVIVHHQVHKVAREFMEMDRTFVDEFFTFLHKYKATKEFLRTEQYSPFKTMKLPSGIKAALSFLHAFTFRHINVFERDVCHYVVEKILKRTECEDAKRAKKEEDEIISRIKAEVKTRRRTPFHHTKTITKETMVNLRSMKETEKSAMKGNTLDDPGNKRPISALKKLHNIEMCKCWKCRHKDLAMTIAVNWRNHGICQLLMSYCVHLKIEHLLPAVRANDADNVKAIVAYLKARFEWNPDSEDAKMALILARFHAMQDIVTYLEKEGVQDERVVQCTCFA